MNQCDCGATAGPLGVCEDYYYAVLAEEQGDPRMYRWHAVVVSTYFLQHPSLGHERSLDVQFRVLQLYVDRGLDALLRFQAHQVARNKHSVRSGYDMRPLEPYAPLPPGEPGGRFRASFRDLPYEDGSFVSGGHEAYGRALDEIAEATLERWGTR